MPRRRPPRVFPERVTSAIESMIPGTLGGRVSSAAPIVRDGVAATVGGNAGVTDLSTGADFDWYREVLSSSGAQDITLPNLPIAPSVHVYLNREVLDEGVDYTLADNVVSLLTAAGAVSTDVVNVRYAYRFGAPVVVPDPDAISDAFDRANSTTTLGTTDTGQTWVALVGTWGITSNQGYMVSGSQQGHAVVDAGFYDNFDIEVALPTIVNGGGGGGGGISFRATGSGAVTNTWFFEASDGILYWRAGATIISKLNVGTTWVSGDVLKIRVVGSLFEFYKNGTLIDDYTDTDNFNPTATQHGLRDFGGNCRFNNFSIVPI